MNSQRRFLKIFLAKLPAFQALFRAIEAEAITNYDLREPILDVGCGDGIFGEAVLGKGKEIFGVDVDKQALCQAKKTDIYKKLIMKDISFLPLAGGEFKTVLANSVLEHIKNLEPVLHEIYRVLAKGGIFILTAPSEKRKELYLGYRMFSFLAMPSLASRIGDWENGLFKHQNCWSGKKWQKELTRIGFSKVSYEYRGSPTTALLSDFFLILAPMGFLERRIFGHYLGWRKYLAPLFLLFLKDFRDKINGEEGVVIVVRAEKP